MRTHESPNKKPPSEVNPDIVEVVDPDEEDMSEDEFDLEELIEALNTPLFVTHHEEMTITLQN